MVFCYRQAEQSLIHHIVYKGQRGAKKQIYNNKADITNTFIAFHLADMLVKYRQAKTPIQIATPTDNKIQVFSYLGVALGKAFFLYTCEVFAFKWAREDFPCNSKYSLHGPIREPHRTINRMNNNNSLFKLLNIYLSQLANPSHIKNIYCTFILVVFNPFDCTLVK